ncbi:MAG TPA: aminotransferase class III-fold pyridoxal phosphate-dependent enzyme, partial [Actinomycetota bacterium]
MGATIGFDGTAVLPRVFDLGYPNVDRGDGVWLETTDGRRVLDATSGGAMVSCFGAGVPELAAAISAQGERLAYYYNHHFTNEPQERLAARLLDVVAPDMARVRFISGGSEANETALQLARLYHVERGDGERWRVISPAQAYHGATMGTLALTGRRSLQEPYLPYLAYHRHVPPATWRTDPTGEAALAELDRVLDEVGPGTVAAFVCEPVSGAALPAYSPPARFWEGLAERRDAHGFLVCFDEVVTGVGRVGEWLAADALPLRPDIVTIGK